MATSVPPPTFGPNGFVAPSGPAVLAGVQADVNAAFGNVLSYSLNSPQGQLASSWSALIVDTNSIFVYYTQQIDPAYADGRMQDAIGRIYFIERQPAQSTVLQVACRGLTGAIIPADTAIVTDTGGNLYTCTATGTIDSTGTVTLPFAANDPGPTAVPAALSIYTAINGWDSAEVVSGVVGNVEESRAQYELRRAASVAKNSSGQVPSILGAVLELDGVLDAYVTENPTGSPLSVGGVLLAAHSVYVAVTGGSADEIARAIWTKKAPGCAYNGSTTVTVLDDNSGYSPPFPSYDVSYQVPEPLPILFAINIKNSTSVPADALTQIQAAIADAFAGNFTGTPRARIGSVIYAAQYAAPVTTLGTWAAIISIKDGSNNTDSAVIVGSVDDDTLTVLSTTSGAIATGQTLSGGGLLAGTLVESGGGATWTLSPDAQTVAGATFTGTGSGTDMTAASVTGTIGIGDTIVGTGVPAGTTILSQTSGTPGGAGVYVTSQATTSAGNAISCGRVLTAAVADQDFVQVRIDQEPTLDANNIRLVLT